MKRRYFFLGALQAAAMPRARAAARRKIVIALFDGFGPEYLTRSEMPVLKRIAVEGGWKRGEGMLPSVTNVNNASLATGSFPDEHGITTNFYYDPATGRSAEMKSPEFLLRPTLLERAAGMGWKTALVSSKDKVRSLCSRGARVAASAEKPEPRFLEMAGKQESLYTPEANYWSMRLARRLLREEADLLYLSTTDYMMHTYAPEAEPSLRHLHLLDRMLGEMLDDHPKLELYLTADHGMNAKTHAVDPVRVLAEAGIGAAAAPLISDNHKAHHQDLGGSYYVYLKDKGREREAIAALRSAAEVEEAYSGEEAARRFRLKRERIGDLFVLARREAVFGRLESLRREVKVRTHGSRHETAVPLFVYGRKVEWGRYRYNLDLTRLLDLERA